MRIFNQCTPWLLTCLSILSVATGMTASPAMMAISGAPNGFETWEQQPVAFSGKIVDCSGDSERDGVFRLAGVVNMRLDPLAEMHAKVEFKRMNQLASTSRINR